MLIYVIYMVAFAVAGFFLCEWKKPRYGNLIFMAAASVALILLSSLRAGTVGIDYPTYQRYFADVNAFGLEVLTAGKSDYRFEPGFFLLNYAVSLFTDNILWFMAVVAVLLNGLTAYYVYRKSASPWISIYIYLTFGFLANSLCFIRQQFSIVILLFAIDFLKNKKLIPYCLIVLLAASFHDSALIMLPVYFIANLPLNKITAAVYGGGTLFILIFSWPIFNFVTKFVYKNYATEAGLYFMKGRSFSTAFVPVVTCITVLFFMKKLLERDKRNIVLINFSLFSALLYTLTLKHFLFQRFGMIFFTLSALLILPEILSCLAVDSSQLQQVESLKGTKPANKNERSKKLKEKAALTSKIKDQMAFYYTAIGYVLFFGFINHLFLLSANRINQIPWLPFWS